MPSQVDEAPGVAMQTQIRRDPFGRIFALEPEPGLDLGHIALE